MFSGSYRAWSTICCPFPATQERIRLAILCCESGVHPVEELAKSMTAINWISGHAHVSEDAVISHFASYQVMLP
jgi:hypothetical protein